VKLSPGRNGPVRIPESVLDDFIETVTVKAGE
jgi:hypothetical protein